MDIGRGILKLHLGHWEKPHLVERFTTEHNRDQMAWHHYF